MSDLPAPVEPAGLPQSNADTEPARGFLNYDYSVSDVGVATIIVAISGNYPDNGNGRTIAIAMEQALRSLADVNADLSTARVSYCRAGLGPRQLVIVAQVRATP